MGKLVYGDSDIDIDIDDRSLAHLQIVIGNKLRRGESFFFSWKDDPAVGDGRSAIWLDRAIPLYFKFTGSRAPAINREWIDALNASANSGTGLIFTDEPGQAHGPASSLRGHI
ncbi:ATP-dependent DNA ligase [Labedella populi]|uniref:ATP-dependent DNA ligase n=1 Tax=Labedella populi TaxID=2498850 RepID=A0A444QC91_9MICO|nr:ATP-dependent DNA ligase [Labedella populi]RWZ64271.1 ATP-dependent DNA ligase [Labedella populi]